MPLNGSGSRLEKLRVQLAHRVLARNGINSGSGIENFTVAANGRGVHSRQAQEDVARDLIRARNEGRDELVRILTEHGEEAARK